MVSIKLTITGNYICEKTLKLLKRFELDSSKLFGITTDGAPSMTGKNNRFVKRFIDASKIQDIVVSHCIVHQGNLC